MSDQRDRVLEYLTRFPGKDDDEIASALKIKPRQTVNQICRRLADAKMIRREQGPRRKLVNFVVGNFPKMPVLPVSHPKNTGAPLTEDQVKQALVTMLEIEGWTVEVAWGRKRGIDIVALREDRRWIIECKGTGSLAPMQNNYFIGVIGELMQRMSDERAKHSIAFPDIPKFRRLWSELPMQVKTKLGLTALFISQEGSVVELSK